MPLDMFWGGAPVLAPTGRDEAIAAGAELRELGLLKSGEGLIQHAVGNDDDGSDDEPEYYNPQTGETSRKSDHKHPVATTTHRAPGGVAPVAKRIRADYDSDDARIIELKQQSYTDDAVATKLAEEGRMRYKATTVGSRWARLKKLLEEKEDQKLDDELTDWHVEDDKNLRAIADALEKKYEEAKKKLEEKKDKDIAAHLAEKMGRKKYTMNACRDRLASLADGTALPPIELDPDPAKRREMRDERIRKATEARAEEAEKARKSEEAKMAKTERKKIERAEANQQKVQAKLDKQAEKTRREQVKEERKANHEAARKRKQLMLTLMRRERDWYLEKERAEKALFKRLTGKNINSKDPLGRANRDGYESDESEESDINELESDEEDELTTDEEDKDSEEGEELDYDGAKAGDEKEEGSNIGSSSARGQSSSQRRSSRPLSKKVYWSDDSSPEPELVSAKAKKSSAKAVSAGPPPVTQETLLNPRSILSDSELTMLLWFRQLPRRGLNESHAQVVARLNAADHALTTIQLDDLLGAALEKTKGKKADKIRRLQEVDAKKSDNGAQKGMVSTDLDFIQQYEGYQGEFSYLIDKYAQQMEGEEDDDDDGRKDSLLHG